MFLQFALKNGILPYGFASFRIKMLLPPNDKTTITLSLSQRSRISRLFCKWSAEVLKLRGSACCKYPRIPSGMVIEMMSGPDIMLAKNIDFKSLSDGMLY